MPFRTDLRSFHEFGQCVQLLAGICAAPSRADTADVGGIVEYREAVTLHDVHQFHELHAETQSRACRCRNIPWRRPWHAQNGSLNSTPRISLNKCLAIPSKRLMTSSCSTKDISQSICVNSGWRSARRSSSRKHLLSGSNGHTGNHQQAVSVSAGTAAGRRTVPGSCVKERRKSRAPSGVEPDQHRSFHFEESLAVQVSAYFHCHFMAKLQIAHVHWHGAGPDSGISYGYHRLRPYFPRS